MVEPIDLNKLTFRERKEDIGKRSIHAVVLIVLLVLYHAFTIFNRAWEKSMDYPDVPAYWWIATSSHAFMLEAFVSMSGYVFGYQVKIKGHEMLSFNNLIIHKAKRLLFPGLLFSVVYYILYYDLQKTIGEIAYTVANGCGYLWFLPMLFWCIYIPTVHT